MRGWILRTGAPLVEESRMVAVQLQHTARRGRAHLVYGADLRATDPRTRGTVHGYYENGDFIREVGSYVQATTTVSSRLQLITALRGSSQPNAGTWYFRPVLLWSTSLGVPTRCA
jgi:iron complex outermembrane receptor protein